MDEFEWITEGILVSLIGVVGLLGNIMSIWKFSRQKVHRIFHNLLLCLAVFDVVSFFILHTFELILLVNLIFFTEQHVKLPPKTRNRPRIEIEKKKVDSFSDVNNKTFL